MNIKLGTNLSEEAIFAKENIKNFVGTFEPFFIEKLNEEFDKSLNEFNEQCSKAIYFYNDLAMRGGKRVRASLAFFTHKMLGGTNEECAINLARAIEMIHAYLLVLDDYTDKSLTRRGGSTAHILTQEHLKSSTYKQTDPKHFGDAIALTAGVIQLEHAHNVIMNLQTDMEKRIEIAKNIHSKIATTGYGQITDVTNSLRPNVTEKDVLDMLKWKTGVYTFENPIHSGAILAGASNEDLKLLSSYAIDVGIAFQIHDDIIGMYGDSEYTGKSNKDDLSEGKMTLLVQYALANAKTDQVEIINKYLGQPEISDEAHDLVQKVLVDCGSLEYSQKIAKELVEKGKNALDNAPQSWTQDGIKFLRGVADYVIQREK